MKDVRMKEIAKLKYLKRCIIEQTKKELKKLHEEEREIMGTKKLIRNDRR